MTFGKTATGTGLLVAACAICCAPLIATPVVALIAAGGAGLALIGQVGLALAIIAGAGAYIWAQRGKQAAAQKAIATDAAGCGCSPDNGCNTGNTCDLPPAFPKSDIIGKAKSLC